MGRKCARSENDAPVPAQATSGRLLGYRKATPKPPSFDWGFLGRSLDSRVALWARGLAASTSWKRAWTSKGQRRSSVSLIRRIRGVSLLELKTRGWKRNFAPHFASPRFAPLLSSRALAFSARDAHRQAQGSGLSRRLRTWLDGPKNSTGEKSTVLVLVPVPSALCTSLSFLCAQSGLVGLRDLMAVPRTTSRLDLGPLSSRPQRDLGLRSRVFATKTAALELAPQGLGMTMGSLK